eukprot:gb/GECG01016317.1/.p1 GENE.gb/GECG01016317.1/~~gb/GECG01016317.1/.p1  ORF type:complete len:339 (+),score=36.36 gb/GECG01016317.1/:1-1017(+)
MATVVSAGGKASLAAALGADNNGSTAGGRVTVCPGHSRPIRQVQFSEFTPDGLFFISASLDKLPMLRDGATGDWIGTFQGHKGAVWSASLNSQATRAATGSADFSAKVWNATNGEELHHFEHSHIVKSVQLSEDGSKLATCCNDKKIRVFDLNNPDKEPLILSPNGKPTVCRWLDGHQNATEVEPHTLLTGSSDGVLRQWNLKKSVETPERIYNTEGEIEDIEVCHQFGLLSVASGNSVQFISISDLSLVKSCNLENKVESVSLHPKKKDTFVVGGTDLWVHVYDYDTCKEVATLKGHHGPVHTIRYSRDGGVYCSGSEDGTIRMWPHTRQFVVGEDA